MIMASTTTLLAHHWLFEPRGGERVLAELAGLFPGAPILTAFKATRGDRWPSGVVEMLPRARASRLQPLYRASLGLPPLQALLLPLLPWAMRRSFNTELATANRLVISDAGLAKTLTLETDAPAHVYLHTPMRHIWHDSEQTLARLPRALRSAGRMLITELREADRQAAANISSWRANSCTTARRAAEAYNLPEKTFPVLHPPIGLPDRPAVAGSRTGLLVVSGMQPYKNDALAIETANRLRLPLTVAGRGPEFHRLQSLAGPTVRLLGYRDDVQIDVLYRTHEALLFCGAEDFGIVPLEAIARGCPVVALGRGGALETIEPGLSGLFFPEPSLDALAVGIEACRAQAWDPGAMQISASRFNPARFRNGVQRWLD